MTLSYLHVKAGLIGWLAGMLVYMLFCTGCAIPIGFKRCYVDTWDHFYPVSTNEVAR